MAATTTAVAEAAGAIRRIQVASTDTLARIRAQSRAIVLVALELTLIVAWTAYITRPYLNPDPNAISPGREYQSHVAPNDFWLRVQQCGPCAWWDGAGGGTPAVLDLTSAPLHPATALAVLLAGLQNGAKLSMVFGFLMVGIGQWWLGRVFGLGLLARLWTAGIAVSAGHMASRAQMGWMQILLSTGACVLVLPTLVMAIRTGTARWAVATGVMLAGAILAGQGYMQIGLAFMLPVAAVLVWQSSVPHRQLARSLALAGAVAVLLSAPLLLTVFANFSMVDKPADPKLSWLQPLSYLPLNLVISDDKFYTTDMLAKTPSVASTALYVGWIPVLAAIAGLVGRPGKRRSDTFFLVLAAFVPLAAASSDVLPRLQTLLGPPIANSLSMIRNAPLIAGLAIAPLLVLSGLGLQWLLSVRWPVLSVFAQLSGAPNAGHTRALALNPIYLLAIPLVISLQDTTAFASRYIITAQLDPTVLTIVNSLKTSDTQLVALPWGEHIWVAEARLAGLKLVDYDPTRFWKVAGRTNAEPVVTVSRAKDVPKGMVLDRTTNGLFIYKAAAPGREYARVVHPDGRATICPAQAIGGNITVDCDLPEAGTLVVKENSWSGWSATVDGAAVRMTPGNWLSAPLESGTHRVFFAYRPIEATLGLILCAIGLIVAILPFVRPRLFASSPAPTADANLGV